MKIVALKRAANAVGGKTARACDSCLRRRARWYCAADDAFLCQGCDTSVHSANPLARRHERVRLKTASSSSSTSSSPRKSTSAAADFLAPSWHQGFKRKARTPRAHHATKPAAQHTAAALAAAKSEPLVPDSEATSLDENAEEEEEEQLLYRVPIFDPVLAEFCSGHVSDDSTATTSSPTEPATTAGEAKPAVELPKYASSPVAFANVLHGFSPSDVDMGDFAADVESLLGRGLDEDTFCMEGLGLTDAGGDVGDCCLGGAGHVKLEASDGDDHKGISDLVAARMAANGETLDLNFACGSPAAGGHPDEEETKAAGADRFGEAPMVVPGCALAKRRRVTLRLDYEAVIDAWASAQGCSSPWADGERPQLNPDDCLPDYMGMWGEAPGVVYTGGGGAGGEAGGGGADGGVGGGGGSHGAVGDGGREARVSRYREKRRTRLFSKKIRYEVRKLNAEKRPRMKGRFVKSASFVGAAGAVGGGVGVGVAMGIAPPQAYAF